MKYFKAAIAFGAFALAESSAMSAVDPVERALFDQLRCRKPPKAGVAVSAMLKKGLLRPTSDRADGSIVFVPVKPLHFLGYPVVRITGWQENPKGGAMPPFTRGPGTAPPNFIELTIKASAQDLRSSALRAGLREARYINDPTQKPFTLQGKLRHPRKLIPGFSVEAGDSELVSKPMRGVSTISCSANEYDFEK